MVRVVFVDDFGERIVEASEGESLMAAARYDPLSTLIGECGGSCICASCHAYIDAAWLRALPPVSINEAQMLEAIEHSRYNSRLTCRVRVGRELDGIVVRVPSKAGSRR
jgi:2Fe-2S ferredoxin